jgi:hypothetical protein
LDKLRKEHNETVYFEEFSVVKISEWWSVKMRISRKMIDTGYYLIESKEAHGQRCYMRGSPDDFCKTCECVCNDGVIDTTNEITNYIKKLKQITH